MASLHGSVVPSMLRSKRLRKMTSAKQMFMSLGIFQCGLHTEEC